MDGRFWCAGCGGVLPAACSLHLHQSRLVGQEVAVEVVVIDRQLQFDASQYGYSNNVGKQHGRSPAEQEAHTRREIEAMKKRGMQQKRDLGRKLDGTRVVGAMPSALLFGMKRQFGDSVIKNPKELAEAHGMWWGD